jgi:hypothetical protein
MPSLIVIYYCCSSGRANSLCSYRGWRVETMVGAWVEWSGVYTCDPVEGIGCCGTFRKITNESLWRKKEQLGLKAKVMWWPKTTVLSTEFPTNNTPPGGGGACACGPHRIATPPRPQKRGHPKLPWVTRGAHPQWQQRHLPRASAAAQQQGTHLLRPQSYSFTPRLDWKTSQLHGHV